MEGRWNLNTAEEREPIVPGGWSGRLLVAERKGAHHCGAFTPAPAQCGETRPLRIAVVSRLVDDGPLFERLLIEARRVRCHIFQCAAPGDVERHASAGDIDVAIVDLTSFSHFAPMEHVPVIIVATGKDEGAALAALQKGALDYLVRETLSPELLERAILYAIERQRSRSELERRARDLESTASNFHNALARNTDGIVIVDETGVVRFVNRAAEKILAYGSTELMGNMFGVPLLEKEALHLDIPRIGGETAKVELRVMETEWEGERAYIISLRDVTRQKRLEAELEEARMKAQKEKDTRFDIIVRSMDEGVLVVNGAGLISFCNDSAARLTGLPAATLLGSPVEQVLGDESWRAFFIPVLTGEEKIRRDTVTISVGESIHHLCARLESIPQGKGAPVGFVCILSDVTHFHERDRMKNDLVAFVAHEFRGPLTVIKGYSAAMRYQAPEEQLSSMEDFLQVVESEAGRLNRLTNSFLDVARIEQGLPLKMASEKVDVRRLVENAVKTQRAISSRCSIELSHGQGVYLVRGDRERLTQVVLNLLSNAVKYSREGGVVKVATTLEADRVVVEVLDEGIGISGKDVKNVFTAFYRAQNAEVQRRPGSGIGLYLCRMIVDAHGGEIGIDSTPGRGTRAYFTLPF